MSVYKKMDKLESISFSPCKFTLKMRQEWSRRKTQQGSKQKWIKRNTFMEYFIKHVKQAFYFVQIRKLLYVYMRSK